MNSGPKPTGDERDRFIPLRHGDLIRRLISELKLNDVDATAFERLSHHLISVFHVEHLSALIQLEELYGPLDPDAETISLSGDGAPEIVNRSEILLSQLSRLLFAAHYDQLTQDDLEQAIEVGGSWNVRLDVDFSVFDQLLVFARGYKKLKQHRRRWQGFFRQETIEFPEFHRLVLAFRLKPSKRFEPSLRTDVVYLKMFKNIPESELEVLLPGSQVRFSILDRGKILLPTISGAALAIYKIITLGLLVTLATVAAFWNWVILIAVTIGYLIRSVLSYFRTRDKYQFGLTRNLFVKNLDNNVGVIYRIFNEAEEQEMCETLLAYAILWRGAPGESMEELVIVERAEAFLRQVLNQEILFDLRDAMSKLTRLGLANVNAFGRWTAVDIDSAPSALQQILERLLERDDLIPRQQSRPS